MYLYILYMYIYKHIHIYNINIYIYIYILYICVHKTQPMHFFFHQSFLCVVSVFLIMYIHLSWYIYFVFNLIRIKRLHQKLSYLQPNYKQLLGLQYQTKTFLFSEIFSQKVIRKHETIRFQRCYHRYYLEIVQHFFSM